MEPDGGENINEDGENEEDSDEEAFGKGAKNKNNDNILEEFGRADPIK